MDDSKQKATCSTSQQKPVPTRKILCVGYTCLDIVQSLNRYAEEDTTKMCQEMWYQRGGNASNSSTVIAQLCNPVELLAPLGDDMLSYFVREDLEKYDIDYKHCPKRENCGCPVSTVLLSVSTGTRTIIHHRTDVGEVTSARFERVNLREYSWIHFEGRNHRNVEAMMQRIQVYNDSLTDDTPQITISFELERDDSDLLNLMPRADVVFISKDFANARGCNTMSETLRHFTGHRKPGGIIINAWGDQGAMGLASDDSTVRSPAFPVSDVIDSLGAGDTFNGAVIFYLNNTKFHFYNRRGITITNNDYINAYLLDKAVTFGCRIAGAKVGLQGFENLSVFYESIRLNIPDLFVF